MKITTAQLQKIIPVSTHSLMRYPDSDSDFPHVERIGRQNYYDQDAIYQWLNTRSSVKGSVKANDKLLSVEQITSLLIRSKAWVWLNIIKSPDFSIINLSPDGKSKNPRRYFIKREIVDAFPILAELAKQEVQDA